MKFTQVAAATLLAWVQHLHRQNQSGRILALLGFMGKTMKL